MTLQSTSSKGRGLPEGGKARRVYLHLHEEIMRGVYAAGAVLPGEQKLAVTLDVSRVTVGRARRGRADLAPCRIGDDCLRTQGAAGTCRGFQYVDAAVGRDGSEHNRAAFVL